MGFVTKSWLRSYSGRARGSVCRLLLPLAFGRPAFRPRRPLSSPLGPCRRPRPSLHLRPPRMPPLPAVAPVTPLQALVGQTSRCLVKLRCNAAG